jgi:hypothetical protein
MVLEALLPPEHARRHPWEIVLLAFVFAGIGVLSTLYLTRGSPESLGLLLITLVALPSIPWILRLFESEEVDLEVKRPPGVSTLYRHWPVIFILAMYFLGLLAGFTFWYLYLPGDQAVKLFAAQVSELKAISGGLVGVGYAVKYTATQAFELIFLHNLEVLGLILVFSVLYGAGAVFVLIWNASVISVFLGDLARRYVLQQPGEYALLAALGGGFLGLLPHGTFELLSYTTGALAGGILSAAVARKAYRSASFPLVVHDIAKLAAWAVVFLAVGAAIESQAFA